MTADGLLEGVVQERLSFLQGSEFWPRKKLLAYQLDETRRLLKEVAGSVPYYKRIFARTGFRPDKVSCLEDLRKLPLLSKDLVRQHHSDFIPCDVDPANLRYMTTGGSTGDPLKVMMDTRFQSLNHANTRYYMSLVGFEPGKSPSVRLHGNVIPQELINQGIHWILEGQRLTMSVYQISEQTCRAYLERINQHRPAYIHAFPSAISLLCRYIDALGLPVSDSIQWVFCDSETLFPWQRDLIKRVLGCRVFNVYGHTEGSVMAISCPESDFLHVLPQVGFLELLDSDGSPAACDAGAGEIIATGFNNHVFPLIRYRTFDYGISALGPCPCGREYPLLREVKGRLQDFVINREGQLVPIAPALFDYQFDWSNVDRFQVYQETPGQLIFRVVRSGCATEHSKELRARIVREFQRILHHAFNVEVEFVDSISHTARGKYRYVEQRLSLQA